MMTPATTGCSSTWRQATLAIDTRAGCPSLNRLATPSTARSSPWKRSHPPAWSMKRRYFICDQVSDSLIGGSSRPSQRSLRKPPASVP